ncbi:hypothetical protein MA03_03730 [Infirmifilum uzonense]|uniref:DNA methylase n=1 Tax=Infirmifilum uzonense TaxID=1550241 RepID=A0A0F7FH32_9CREN|nr:hypothetical protein [Infirmifilum uzonense]AKG38574.1 hypothetical protein MA03_03730 [Infirmifilum uzonense]
MLLDSLPPRLISLALEACLHEKGRRIPIHGIHKWWSRRYSAVYRLILASYVFEDSSYVERALVKPELMRPFTRGKVFFEPLAGGGTGLAEAALAGWDVYGFDVNPVAALAAGTSVGIVSSGVPSGFKDKALWLLDESLRRVSQLWFFEGGLVTHIFVSRSRIPVLLSRMSNTYVTICPRCFTINESKDEVVKCGRCGHTYKVSHKPTIKPRLSLPEEITGWKAFAVEVRWISNGKYTRKYISVPENPSLKRWLESTREHAEKSNEDVVDALNEKIDVLESKRLVKAGIKTAKELFSGRQLASFRIFLELSREKIKDTFEKKLVTAALSQATQSSNLLARWYPKLGEIVPSGGIKALWVPEYTAVVNPLAHMPGKLRTLARGTIASAINAQLKAWNYVQAHGGPSYSNWRVEVGDARSMIPPVGVDLVVVDPPYGRIKSYAALSLPHYFALKLYTALEGSQLANNGDLKEVEASEVTPYKKKEFFEGMYRVICNSSKALSQNGRLVLMYNSTELDEWRAFFKIFKECSLSPTAVYWVLGETPSGLTASSIKGMFLIVLKKDLGESATVIFENAVKHSIRLGFKIDKEIERKAFESLTNGLIEAYPDLELNIVY